MNKSYTVSSNTHKPIVYTLCYQCKGLFFPDLEEDQEVTITDTDAPCEICGAGENTEDGHQKG